MRTLYWCIPFSEYRGVKSHLIDTSSWLTHPLCNPKRMVNSRLATPPTLESYKCGKCRRMEANGHK